MGAVNPYDKFLDGRSLEAILPATAGEVGALSPGLGAGGRRGPAQIVAHLADCGLVFAFRLRQTLAEDAPLIQPFDQDKWAATYTGVPANQALEVFTAMRGWNLRLIGLSLPHAAARPLTHPERGTMTFL